MLSKKHRRFLFSSLLSLIILVVGVIFFPDQELELLWGADGVSVVERSKQVVAEATTSADLLPVVRVVDGDTIRVMLDGREQVVRLANINAPESVDPRREVECMGLEASQYVTALLTEQSIRLLSDDTQVSQDRYGRLIRFVQLQDGRDVGKLIIEAGFARSSPYGKGKHRYFDEYQAAQAQAQQNQLGLWSQSDCLSTAL